MWKNKRDGSLAIKGMGTICKRRHGISVVISGLAAFILLFSLTGCGWGSSVSISFRPSVIGLGKVMRITNDSDKTVNVKLTVTGKGVCDIPLSTSLSFEISPKGTYEIGVLEGWMFTKGDKYKIEVENEVFPIYGFVL